jgi:SAM-dependent methyltransferase
MSNTAKDGRESISNIDVKYLRAIRQNVSSFLSMMSREVDLPGVRVLDVAPQDHEGARPYFSNAFIQTLDIDPLSSADFIADLCSDNTKLIPNDTYDIIVCTEVLEHVLNPFAAIGEVRRMLKPGGRLLASSPFNFRIHGPLPDCWRFTEHGWRALLADFKDVDIQALNDPDRFLAPIHYTVVATKDVVGV